MSDRNDTSSVYDSSFRCLCPYSKLSNYTVTSQKIDFIILNYKNKNNFVSKYRQIKRKTNINKLVILLKI